MKARSSTSSSRGGGGGGERTNFIVVLLVLGSLGCLKLCCVGLFARGFLFVRVELAQKSSSSSSSHAGESFATDASSSSSSSSFTTTTTTSLVIDKLIVLIIDAARYDWVANCVTSLDAKKVMIEQRKPWLDGAARLLLQHRSSRSRSRSRSNCAKKWRKERATI